MSKIDEMILLNFIPSITGGMKINENELLVLSLPAKFGGLGIPIFSEQCKLEYSNSRLITAHLCEAIKNHRTPK